MPVRLVGAWRGGGRGGGRSVLGHRARVRDLRARVFRGGDRELGVGQPQDVG